MISPTMDPMTLVASGSFSLMTEEMASLPSSSRSLGSGRVMSLKSSPKSTKDWASLAPLESTQVERLV